MRFKLLGQSGLRVSELCLGTMTFGDDLGWGADPETSRVIYDTYRSAGGNFVDTANEIYTGGTAERLVGEFIAPERDSIVLATKFTDAPPGADGNFAGNGRKSLTRSVERSLKRLRTDYLDLLWVHSWDFTAAEEEVMRSLEHLVASGKVLHIGVSDAPAWVVARCNTIAELRGWSSFVGLQIEYSLVQRTVERELLPMARALDLGVLGWSPLGSGVLSGKYATDKTGGGSKRAGTGFVAVTERNLAIANAAAEVAAEIGSSTAQVAINWVRAKGVIPILGATKARQIEDNLDCLRFGLTPEQIARLDAASAIELGFPHDFLAATRGATYGGVFEQIDRHRDRGLGVTPQEAGLRPADQAHD